MEKLNQWLTLSANIGVIVGIVFLAFELNQNNRLLESEARLNQADSIRNAWREIYLNPDLALMLAKAYRGEPLNELETIQLEAYQRRIILGLLFQYEEFRNGALDTINISAWRVIYRGGDYRPSLAEAWTRSRATMRPEFVEFFESNIINP